MRALHSKPWLMAELPILMIGLPMLLYYALPTKYLLPVIWSAGLYSYLVLRHTAPEVTRDLWSRHALIAANIVPMLKRFACCAALLTLLTRLFAPALLFSFVRTQPAFWLLVMVAYPLLSVIPQEIIFRSFFFARYKHLFTTPRLMILASGIAFGFAHILFHNWVAPLLCLLGGVMFARTYHQQRSLLLVSLEHALYGNFLFTLGLGRYFYHGTVAAAL